MNTKKLLSLYGLKWNPFTPDLPIEGILKSQRFEHFCWRVESLALEGGFALITGDSGLGKSTALRALHDRLSQIRELNVGAFTRPQSGVVDFYREMGSMFGLELKTSNRWGGYKMLRERWQAHIDSTLLRPVILIDEAQEMLTPVLAELRLLASQQFDSQILLTIVLAGDNRLSARLKSPELVPLGTRIRTRHHLETFTKSELLMMLTEGIKRSGREDLMGLDLMETLTEHSAGNPRILMTLANEVLSYAIKKEAPAPLDAGLYLEAFPIVQSGRSRDKTRPTARS